MKRVRNKTVTDIPILLPSKPADQEGVATFSPEFGAPSPVRALRHDDLQNARKHLSKGEAKHFYAVSALTNALQHPSDTLALRKAIDALQDAYKLLRGERGKPGPLSPADLAFARGLSQLVGLPPEEALEHYEGLRPGPRASANPRWLLSYEISRALLNTRIVLWWSGDRFSPAIWCGNIKTGFYVRALLGVVGGKGFRICPHCGQPFFQERSDQNYCSIAHREAHRVARWRSQKKERATKERKYGPRKAR